MDKTKIDPAGADPSRICHNLSIVSRFDAACAAIPCPTLTTTDESLSLPREHRRFLVQNSSGTVLLSPHVTSTESDAQVSRDTITGALQSALHLISCTNSQTPQHAQHDESSFTERLPQQLSEQESAGVSKSDSKLLMLLGRPPFVPLQELTTLTWENSLSKKVLENFIDKTCRTKDAPPASISAIPDDRLAGPIPQIVPSSSLQASANKQALPPLDIVVFTAQQEAAASTMLRDIRAAHARLRKSASTFRQGEAPVWALLAQRGGKLKPEAAAEMARARIAAAEAAAVMRDVASSKSSVSGASDPASALLSPLPSSQADGREFSREHISPQLRPTITSARSLPSMNNLKGPSAASTSLHFGNENASAVPARKKRVSFANDVIFQQK